MAQEHQRIEAISRRTGIISSSDVSNIYEKSKTSAPEIDTTRTIAAAGIANLFSGQTIGLNGFAPGASDGILGMNITTIPGYDPEKTLQTTWQTIA